MTKPTPLETLTRGHRHPASDSPAAIRVRRKHAESAARFCPDPRMERMLELRDAADPRFDQALPATFDTTALDQARQQLEAAADAYCREAKALQGRTGDVWNELVGLAPTPGISPLTGDASIQAGGVTYRKPSFQRQVRDAVYGAFYTHFPRMQVNLERV